MTGTTPPSFDAHRRFEAYLVEVATRFVQLPGAEVQTQIGRALEGLLEALEVDRCSLSLFDDSTVSLRPDFYAVRPGVPLPPTLEELASTLPWYVAQVRSGNRLVFLDLPEGIPPEAGGERDFVARSGMKSHVSVPMRVGGETQGALGCATFRERRDWDAHLVSRLELLADVFGSALHRRDADARLRAAEALNQSILASVPDPILVVDDRGRVIARNDAWVEAAERGLFLPVAVGQEAAAVADWAQAHGGAAGEAADLRAVLSGERSRYEGLCRHPGEAGPRVYAVTAAPLEGAHAGTVVVHTDVTDLHEARTALEQTLREVRELQQRLEAENVVLRGEIRHARGFDTVVGTSPALARVLAQVEQVAPTDAPVLLLGETGTGKGLLARAIHERSPRRARAMVAVNCAALPATLIESELFGYEKGAFTGALQRTIGRFEVADGGTLFLDEIGDLPLELQAKLLRVLQTGEFERLGSARTLRGDVRVIAATNRDLEHEVREGRFRADLYYRLAVFPVVLPPLRDRREDIPLLVWHFIQRRQAKLGRSVKRIPERLMRALVAHDWPGNVRELENVLERALISTTGETLAADPVLLDAAPARTTPRPGTTLADAARAHIVSVLEECGWKVTGRGNAAERLGLKRSTLQYRMQKLGIRRKGA